MKLNDLVQHIPHTGASDAEISAITYDSRKAAAGSLFVCLVGAWLRHDLWFLHFIVRLDHHRAFYAFLLDLAGDVVRLMNVAGKCFVIRMATAGAEEFRPAVDTFRLAEDVVHAEVAHHLEVLEPFIDVADDVAFSSDELVAGVNIAIRYDGEILVTGAAAAKTLREADRAQRCPNQGFSWRTGHVRSTAPQDWTGFHRW